MKKSTKLIIGILVSSLILTGTGYAAVKKFKGFQVVNVVVNGSTYNGDVPAVLVDGKVWVSAKVADKMGGKSTYSKSANKLTITGKVNNLDKIKFYGELAQYYDDLESLSELLVLTKDGLHLAYDDIVTYNDVYMLNNVDNSMKDIINIYNKLLGDSVDMKKKALKYNVQVDDIEDILSYYDKAIDYSYDAIKGLRDFSVQKNQTNYNAYIENVQLLFDYAMDGDLSSNIGKKDFFRMISKY